MYDVGIIATVDCGVMYDQVNIAARLLEWERHGQTYSILLEITGDRYTYSTLPFNCQIKSWIGLTLTPC